jgi:hypothetical protein
MTSEPIPAIALVALPGCEQGMPEGCISCKREDAQAAAVASTVSCVGTVRPRLEKDAGTSTD